MTTLAKRQIKNKSSKNNSLLNSVRILSDITRRDIEKSYNINDAKDNGAEAHFSNRYGWTLRRAID